MVIYDINIRGRIYGSLIRLQCRKPGFDPWVEKIPWRRAWQPTPIFLHGESPWTEEPGGLQSMGAHRVGHNWATKHTCTSLFSMGYISMGAHFAKISISYSTVFREWQIWKFKNIFLMKAKTKTALLKKMKRKCGLLLLDNSVRTCCCCCCC